MNTYIHYIMAEQSPLIETAFTSLSCLQRALDDALNAAKPSADVIDMRAMESTHKNMARLSEIYDAMYGMTAEFHNRLTAIHVDYTAAIERMHIFLNTVRGQPPEDTAWRMQTKRGTRIVQGDRHDPVPMRPTPDLPMGTPMDNQDHLYQKVVNPPRIMKPSPIIPPKHQYIRIQTSPTTDLSAVRVSTWSEVTANGELYYVENCGHFAFRIAGHLFHAGIGTIFTTESEPTKIKECMYGNGCNRADCTYYHDPLRCPGSKDIRNYAANSWLYSTPGSALRQRSNSRNYGSLQYLDSDIQQMKPPDCRRFVEQAAHDIICGLLLFRYYGSAI